MSDSLLNLRRKIDGAVKLGSVVRTMKAVAASSIGQYEAALKALGDYERSVELGLSVCFRRESMMVSSPGRAKGTRVLAAIVFGSDQGLVGQFNEVMAEFAAKTLTGILGEKRIWAVGERIHSRLIDAGLPVATQFIVPTSVSAITSLVGQLQISMELQIREKCDEVYVFHAQPTSASLYQPVSQRLLPLDKEWGKDFAHIPWPTRDLPEVVGEQAKTLRDFVREFLFISLYKSCAESLASENASRLAAMQRAEKNIDASLSKLNQAFYRQRQNSIDEELFDVVSGFNALARNSTGNTIG